MIHKSHSFPCNAATTLINALVQFVLKCSGRIFQQKQSFLRFFHFTFAIVYTLLHQLQFTFVIVCRLFRFVHCVAFCLQEVSPRINKKQVELQNIKTGVRRIFDNDSHPSLKEKEVRPAKFRQFFSAFWTESAWKKRFELSSDQCIQNLVSFQVKNRADDLFEIIVAKRILFRIVRVSKQADCNSYGMTALSECGQSRLFEVLEIALLSLMC